MGMYHILDCLSNVLADIAKSLRLLFAVVLLGLICVYFAADMIHLRKWNRKDVTPLPYSNKILSTSRLPNYTCNQQVHYFFT